MYISKVMFYTKVSNRKTVTNMKWLCLPFTNEHKHPITIRTFGPCLNPSVEQQLLGDTDFPILNFRSLPVTPAPTPLLPSHLFSLIYV